MKLIKVRCDYGKKIEIEDTGSHTVNCPDYCLFKEKGRCGKVSFRYTVKLADSVNPDVPYRSAIQDRTVVNSRTEKGQGIAQGEVDFKYSEQTDSTDDTFGETEKPQDNLYDSVFFGAEEETDSSMPTEQSAHSDRSNSNNKYNSLLVDEDSLFYNIKAFTNGEYCFRFGSEIFYERSLPGKYSSGNIDGAIEYIFSHWLVSEVFTENGKFTELFLRILKAKGLKNKEKELKEIQNEEIDINRKFFKLFYEIIFELQMKHFYFNIGKSKDKIIPKFYSTDDFYKKLASAPDPSKFLMKYTECFEELLYYLNPMCKKEERRDWFKENITLMLAEKNRTVAYAEYKDDNIVIFNLGNINDFVEKMLIPAPLDELGRKIKFLEKYEITSNYEVIKRDKPLVILKPRGAEDDCVYEISGIYKYNTAQCATAYNYYTTIIKEYIDKFVPKKVTIGNVCVTAENYYSNLKDVISAACRHLNEENLYKQEDVKKFYFIKSLVNRGVFAEYESNCETTKLDLLKSTFFENKFSLEAYFGFSDIEHMIRNNSGRYVTIDKYISDCISMGVTTFITMVEKDEVIKTYFSTHIKDEDYKRKHKELENALEKYSNGIS